jgi:hypothetical protein
MPGDFPDLDAHAGRSTSIASPREQERNLGKVGPHQKMATRAANGSRAAAIRLKCLDCCCGSAAEVRRCHLTDCALHPYRMGVYRRETVEHDDARQVPSSGSDGAT